MFLAHRIPVDVSWSTKTTFEKTKQKTNGSERIPQASFLSGDCSLFFWFSRRFFAFEFFLPWTFFQDFWHSGFFCMFSGVVLMFVISIHIESCQPYFFPLFLVTVSFASIEMQCTYMRPKFGLQCQSNNQDIHLSRYMDVDGMHTRKHCILQCFVTTAYYIPQYLFL